MRASRTAWSMAGFAGALAWLSVIASPALAASAWLAPLDISPTGGPASRPQIAVDAVGTAVAVWRHGVDGGEVRVQSSVRPAGGSWQTPVDISSPGLDGSAPLSTEVPGPRVAVDALGNAIAVWQRFNGTSLVIQAAERPAGGAWGAPVNISLPAPGGYDAGAPSVAFDPRGNAVAVWHRSDALTGRATVLSADRPAGRAWQPPVAVSDGTADASGALIAVAADGTALAAWTSFGGAPRSSLRPAGGSWLPSETIAGDTLVRGMDIALDPAGSAVAVWLGGASGPFGVRAAVRPAQGAWQAPADLGPDGYHPSLTVDAQGAATAVWQNDDAAHAASKPAGGDWEPSVQLGPSAPSFALSAVSETAVASDVRGVVTAAWIAGSPSGSDVLVSRRAGAAWEAPVLVSAPGRAAVQPRLAVDPLGNAVALWADRIAGGIGAAGFDASAPELRSLAIPASGAIGRRVAFAVSPFDVWSPLGPVRWAFGDGSAGTGASVSHTFLRLGPHTVDVSVTDALGNPATATRTIVIRPSVLGLRVTPSRYRAARRGSVHFRLPAASRVRFVVQRVRGGRRVGRRCVGPTAGNRRRVVCNRYISVGAFSLTRRAGRHRVRLPARVGGRVLRAGRYRLKATPTAERLTGAPSRTGFRVTR